MYEPFFPVDFEDLMRVKICVYFRHLRKTLFGYVISIIIYTIHYCVNRKVR